MTYPTVGDILRNHEYARELGKVYRFGKWEISQMEVHGMYWCWKCVRHHWDNSAIGKKHAGRFTEPPAR